MAYKKIGLFIGSLRQESFNRKFAKYIQSIAPNGYQMDIIEIADLPYYNEDLDNGNPPASFTAFRDRVAGLDALMFFTPEYNRSVPAVLKNAVDVASRPYGANVWDGKPAAVLSASIGGVAGFGANHHLRQSLVFVNVPVMAQPEVYLGNVSGLFNDAGTLTDENCKGFLADFLKAYQLWVERFLN
ncbi:MAG: NADPH-dependent FMN reductase [Sphingobacterium sp.]